MRLIDRTRRYVLVRLVTTAVAGVAVVVGVAVFSVRVLVSLGLLDPAAADLRMVAAVAAGVSGVIASVLVALRVPSWRDAASMLDQGASRDYEFRTALEVAESQREPGEVTSRLWRRAELDASDLVPRGVIGLPVVSRGAWSCIALALVFSVVPIPMGGTHFVEDTGGSALPSPMARADADGAGGGPTASASAAVTASVDSIRGVAEAIAEEARQADDHTLAAIAEELSAIVEGFVSGDLDAGSLSAALDGVVRQIDEAYAASPVRRDSYRGSLVDSSLTLTAEASGVGDHSIDDGRPDVHVNTPSDEADVDDDDVAVHHSERSNFRRVGVVDDAGGGPGDPARNLGENGFVETNVNLERTTTVGFDPYDQNLDAVRSQLAALEELPQEGMRAVNAGGGDGDAGTAAADLHSARQTEFDLALWEVFEREIVDLAAGRGGRGTIQLSAPQTMQGTVLMLAGDDTAVDMARAEEVGAPREMVSASAIGLAIRYFGEQRRVALASVTGE